MARIPQKRSRSLVHYVATRVLVCILVLVTALVVLLAPLTFKQAAAAIPEIPLEAVVNVQEVDEDSGSSVEPEPEVEPGSLRLRVKPWGKVWLDGRRVGATPIKDLRVSAGEHIVVVGNPRLRVRRKLVVNIHSAQRTKLFVDLTRAPRKRGRKRR